MKKSLLLLAMLAITASQQSMAAHNIEHTQNITLILLLSTNDPLTVPLDEILKKLNVVPGITAEQLTNKHGLPILANKDRVKVTIAQKPSRETIQAAIETLEGVIPHKTIIIEGLPSPKTLRGLNNQ